MVTNGKRVDTSRNGRPPRRRPVRQDTSLSAGDKTAERQIEIEIRKINFKIVAHF